MFVQVIQGHVSNPTQVRARLDKWAEQVPLERWDGLAAHPGLLTTEH